MIGAIISPHGLRGEMNVYPTTDDLERYRSLREVLLLKNGSYQACKVEGIDRSEDAEPLRGVELYVDRKDAIALEEGEYFVGDLVGCEIREDGQKVGVLKDILKTGANDVYVIEMLDGKERLLPSIPDCVLEKCPEEGYITVHFLPEI